MDNVFSRRKFIKYGSVTAAGITAAGSVSSGNQSEVKKPLRAGIIGTGKRGQGLLRTAIVMKDIEFTAFCDINKDNLAAAQSIVEKAGMKKPEGYSDGDYAYEKMLSRGDLDAVIIASPWQWHTKMAVTAMNNGVYAGVEVPSSQTIEECWELVNTHEKTKIPCMMLENWSFRRDNLAVLNMLRDGLFGQTIHCHCAHSHDCIDHWFFDKDGNIQWGGEFLVNRNCDQYPTHSLGPVLSWMDINCGDYLDTVTSNATESWGINAYFTRKFGANHPNAKRKYKQGDIVTSLIRTVKGKTIVVNYDMQLPRPYDNRWMIQGTLGVYDEDRSVLYITDKSPKYHEWESFAPYQDKYDHPWWKSMMENPENMGHGGTDYLELEKFFEAAREKKQTPIDVYDSVVMSCLVALSGESIEKGGVPVKVPDFTRGKWKTNKPSFAKI